jgi:hypothetical protein
VSVRPVNYPCTALQGHISTVPIYPHGSNGNTEPVYELDGLCHCAQQGESSPIGMCRRCFRLDRAKASTL